MKKKMAPVNGIISDLSILIENISNPEPLPVSLETIPSSVGNPESLPKFYTLPLDISYKLLENPSIAINDNYKTVDGKLKFEDNKLTAYILDAMDTYSSNSSYKNNLLNYQNQLFESDSTFQSRDLLRRNNSTILNKNYVGLIESSVGLDNKFIGAQRNNFGDINLTLKKDSISLGNYFQPSTQTNYRGLSFTSDNTGGFSNKFISSYKY